MGAAGAGFKGRRGVPWTRRIRPVQLNEKQRRHLRGLAHPLKPVILVGNAGVTDAVVAETARALHDHELIKVRLPGGDRDARDASLAALADRTGSALVTRIGHVAVLYRARPGLQRILLPD
jgi:RNA-binding protein